MVGLSGEARQAGLSGEAQQNTVFFNSGNMVIVIFVRFATSESGGMFSSSLRNFTFFSFQSDSTVEILYMGKPNDIDQIKPKIRRQMKKILVFGRL